MQPIPDVTGRHELLVKALISRARRSLPSVSRPDDVETASAIPEASAAKA